jgi:GT2 family glycosyltransferase
MTTGDRLLLITPVRNEAANIERTARALAAQTRPPDVWLVVDDDSDDATPWLLRELAEDIPFMRVLAAPPARDSSGPDRLALAAEARAFNWALGTVEREDFTHLGKLDGDIELPPEYFETVLAAFRAKPELGLAGGELLEPKRGGGWEPARTPQYHVRGALKLYSRACFDAIGGIEERLGWDTIDETYARMRGYATRSLPELVALHHRPVGSADGALRGRARHGECAYILNYSLPWVLLRSVKVGLTGRPPLLSGVALVYGYLRAALTSDAQVDDPQVRRFVRRELRERMLRPLRLSSN